MKNEIIEEILESEYWRSRAKEYLDTSRPAYYLARAFRDEVSLRRFRVNWDTLARTLLTLIKHLDRKG